MKISAEPISFVATGGISLEVGAQSFQGKASMSKDGRLSALFSGTISSIIFSTDVSRMFDFFFGIFQQPLGTCGFGHLGDIISSLPREELQGSMRFDFRDVSMCSFIFYFSCEAFEGKFRLFGWEVFGRISCLERGRLPPSTRCCGISRCGGNDLHIVFFKSLTEKNLRLTETITRMSIVSCRVTQQVYSIFDSKRARHSSAWPLNGCVAPRLVAKIRSALPYLAQLAKGGSRPTAALEKSMIDTTTAMPQVGDSGLQGDVFHKSHKKTTCIL